MLRKWMALCALMLLLAAPASAEKYVYSNEQIANVYFECEDFDNIIPEALSDVFRARLMPEDEILCGTMRMARYHSEPDHMQEQDALLALRRGERILLLGASCTDGMWRCAVETDCFFVPGQRFDVTVLPGRGAQGKFLSTSLALVCGVEEFLVNVAADGSIRISEYRAPCVDGSMLHVDVDEGTLYARRMLDDIEQESGDAVGVIPARLYGWTYDAFPKSCAQVRALDGLNMPEFGENEAVIFGVNLREQPTGQSRSMGKYTARVYVMDRREGITAPWYRVQLGDTAGWVSGTYLLWPQQEKRVFRVAECLSEMPRAACTQRETALRISPDGSPSLTLPEGIRLQVIAQDGNWLHVIVPEEDGWAANWDAAYGFVHTDDVIAGTSPADVQYP